MLRYRLNARLIASGFLVVLALGMSLASSAQAKVGPTPIDGDAASCDHRFLTFPTWYRGLTVRDSDGNCEIKSPSKLPGASSDDKTGGITAFIWTIALNILEIMLQLVGYASVGYIIYGGYKYIYSAGSPNGMVSARKTILNAVVGLIISIMSVAIVNTIAGGF